MNDQWGFDPNTDGNDYGNPNSENTPKGLRTWAESVNKENKELKSTLAEIQKELAQQKVGNVFSELGISPQAAALYTGDTTKEAVSQWADSIRSAFNMQGDAPQVTTPPAPVLTQEQQSSYQDFTNAGGNQPPSTSMDDFMRGVNSSSSQADLIKLFEQMNRS